jgi:hypothetical protein
VPEHWDFVTAYDDVEFLGGTQTRDVLVTGIRTKPSGIYLEVRVPRAEFDKLGAQVVNAAALSMWNIFETLAKQPYVAGVQWGQQPHSGQLQDVAVITVESDRGNAESSLTVPLVQLGPNLDHDAITKLHKQLNDLDPEQ